MELAPSRFEGVLDGWRVSLYVLRNATGMTACITNYGAKIEQLLVPDNTGKLRDVMLGYDSLEAVVHGAPSVGAFIGRYAGRIAHARFTLDGYTHALSANNGPHSLHGGLRGSRFRVFDAIQRNASSVEMSRVFEDGEEGFPGTLALRLMYSLTDANELVIDSAAVALDKPGVASFTTHGFFNLDGHAAGNAMAHEVTICASQYLAADAELINTGELLTAEGTAFDLRKPVRLETMVEAHQSVVTGYDTCYVLDKPEAGGLALAARVRAPTSGIVMDVLSTEPVMQFFTGLEAGVPLQGGPGKEGMIYCQQYGLCLEPQGYPNAPNCPEFPSAVIEPGQPYTAKTVYRFSA
jgi:aldose 1-epimerase